MPLPAAPGLQGWPLTPLPLRACEERHGCCQLLSCPQLELALLRGCGGVLLLRRAVPLYRRGCC